MVLDTSNRVELFPLDRGAAFGWSNKGIWFRLALFFAILDAAISLIFSAFSGASGLIFAFIPAGIVHCWFVASIVNLVILRMRGQLQSVFPCILSAFGVVPKVFLSSMVIFIVFGLGIPLSPITLPMWLIAALFSWAPLFVAADATLPEDKKKRGRFIDDENEAAFPDFGEDDDDEERRISSRPHRYFDGRPSFDLGLSRSVKFSLSQMSLTLYLVWFVVLSVTLPFSIVAFLFGLESGSFGIVVHTFLEPFIMAIVLGSMTAALVFGLPEESKDELGITETGADENHFIEPIPYFRLQGRLPANLIFLFLSLLSIGGISNYMISATAIPETVAISPLRIEQIGADVNLTISIRDNAEQEQWTIDPQSFVLATKAGNTRGDRGPKKGDQPINMDNSSFANPETDSTWLSYFEDNTSRSSFEPIHEIIYASGVALYDENNNIISLKDIGKVNGGIRLMLTFGNTTIGTIGDRDLFYQRIPGFGTFVANIQKFKS